jgi:phosphoribosylanthranilate isomerase
MSVEIKICGLTNVEDAEAALRAGVDYLGFVLYPKSPRAITPAKLKEILAGLSRPCRAVAVVVNESRAAAEELAAKCGLWAVQVHGDEPAAEFTDCACRLWRAVCVCGQAVTPDPSAWPSAERYVVDASSPDLYGGTGSVADWAGAAALSVRSAVMLAGGLTPENVGAAIDAVRPAGVDVASGVESAPGRKDHEKLLRFVEEVRQAAAGVGKIIR